MFVILASRSVRLSPHCDWSAESSCRPQIAAPTLPVAIMEGGYMAKLKSVGERNTNLVKCVFGPICVHVKKELRLYQELNHQFSDK